MDYLRHYIQIYTKTYFNSTDQHITEVLFFLKKRIEIIKLSVQHICFQSKI